MHGVQGFHVMGRSKRSRWNGFEGILGGVETRCVLRTQHTCLRIHRSSPPKYNYIYIVLIYKPYPLRAGEGNTPAPAVQMVGLAQCQFTGVNIAHSTYMDLVLASDNEGRSTVGSIVECNQTAFRVLSRKAAAAAYSGVQAT